MLSHKFPKIREYAAQQFYVSLLQECGASVDGKFHYSYLVEPEASASAAASALSSADPASLPRGMQDAKYAKVSILTDEIEPATLLLTTTNWMEPDTFQESLKQIYEAFKQDLPANFTLKPQSKAGAKKKTGLLIKREVEGYEQLVREFHGNL